MKSKITLKNVVIISCVVVLTAALTGAIMVLARPMVTPQSQHSNTEQAEPVATNSSTQTSTAETGSYIGEEEAKAIALAHAGVGENDVSHMLCKLDYDDGVAEYEVEFWDGATEYDYEINAVNGEIIGYDYDMESYNANSATTDSSEYIGEEEAKAIALAHAGVGEGDAGYIKCEFDLDDGRAEYDVEWEIGRTEYEYTVSATDGVIYEFDVD